MGPVGRLRRGVNRQLGEFSRSVYVVSVGQFVAVFRNGVVYAFVPVYFASDLGIPTTLIGGVFFDAGMEPLLWPPLIDRCQV